MNGRVFCSFVAPLWPRNWRFDIFAGIAGLFVPKHQTAYLVIALLTIPTEARAT